MLHPFACVLDHALVLAEGESHVLLTQVRVLLRVEGRAGDRHHSLLVRQLEAEGEVLGHLLAALIGEVLLGDLHARDVGDDEVAALWHPQVEVELGANQLLQQQVPVLAQFLGVVAHVGAAGVGDHLETFASSVLHH